MFTKKENFEIKAPIKVARMALDTWLDQEQLTLSEKKKQRVAALLAHYFHDQSEISPARIKNYLGNLAGGADVDLEDDQSVEIEIQRILGHTESAGKHALRPILKTGIGLLVLNFFLIVINISVLVYQQINHSDQAHSSVDLAPITTAQKDELTALARRVANLEQTVSGTPITPEKIWDILMDTNEFASIDYMTQEKVIQVRRHLKSWISLLSHQMQNRAAF